MVLYLTTLIVSIHEKLFKNLNFFLIIMIISVEEKKVKSLEHILETRKIIKAEIAMMKEKLQKTREQIAEFKSESSATQATQQ
jgi:hypothetical protein